MNFEFNKTSISDATELCTIASKSFKSSCVSVSFVVPLSEKASFYALVPNVLERSSANYPTLAHIERKLALLYGTELATEISKIGESHVIKFAIACIDDRFALDGEAIAAECSKLLFEIIFNPKLENGVFCTEEVEGEKRILCERLYAEQSDKRTYAKNRCEEIMFEDEAYGIHRLGDIETIMSITPATLYDAYLELLRTAKISVCVSGNTNVAYVKELFEGYISKVSRSAESSQTLFVEAAEDVQYVKEQEAVKQGKLVMGFRLGMSNSNDNYAARRVMVDLFGGSPHSKLFTVVREKMSLCYYCSARMIRAKGIMFVQSGIESYNEEKAKNAILEQLEEIKKGNFTDSDIESSVRALEDSFKSVTDSAEALESWYMSQCVSGEYLAPDVFIEAFKAVTREDIIKVAKDVTLDTVFMLEGTLGEGEAQ